MRLVQASLFGHYSWAMEGTSAVSAATRKDLEILTSTGIADGWYLAGGTALAFLLSHRESHDLDFFRNGLAYFEDAEKEPMPRMIRPTAWEEVKAFFLEGAKNIG